jgi:DnaJ-domain-containing protein 1
VSWLIYGALAFAVYKLATSSSKPATGRKKKSGAKARRASGDDPYVVLGVSPEASAAEIRRAYQERIHAYHPDRVASAAPELRQLAEERTKQLNAAYAKLAAGRNLP